MTRGCRQAKGNRSHEVALYLNKGVLKTVPQSQIDHIIMAELAQAGVFGAVEKHKTGGDLPVVADLVFREDLRG